MFSENDRKNALFGSAGILVLIVACVASIGLYKLAVPAHVDADTTNITYEDYEAAFLKWQESEIDDYEITLHGGADDVVLRVGDAGTSIEVLQHLHQKEPVDYLNMSEYSASLRELTVEYMFELAEGSIGAYERGSFPRSEDASYDFFYDFDARFHPELGYPVYLGEYKRISRPSREISWRERDWWPVEVKDFKVLDSR